jgi:two-component sensor histidine kinase
MFGYSREELIGNKIAFIYSEDQLPKLEEALKASMEGDWIGELVGKRKNGELFPIAISSSLVKDDEGNVIALMASHEDISERKRAQEQIKASLNEKEVLLKEIHHRVKNNMQIITSLLNLQSRYVKDKHDLEIFMDSQNRVKSMALIHEELYQSEDLAGIDFADYVQKLASHLFSLYSVSTAVIKLSINIKDVLLDINTAIPCGLIINELVSNSLKYAFPDGQEGEIRIKLYASKDDTFSLIVHDNGIGLSEDLDFRDTESLGLQLVTSLVEQLEGTIELDRSEGTAFKIVFEKPK